MTQVLRIVLTVVLSGVLETCMGLAARPKMLAPAVDDCKTDAVQTCLGGATELVPELYFHPLNTDLLLEITESLCGRGLEKCMAKVEGNCSQSLLAPYATVTSAINYICQSGVHIRNSFISSLSTTDSNSMDIYHTSPIRMPFVVHGWISKNITNHAACITSPASQRGFRFCFQLFKIVFDNAITDITLGKSQVKAALCSAYDDVTSCVTEAAEKSCDVVGTSYVENLVKAVSSANRGILECS